MSFTGYEWKYQYSLTHAPVLSKCVDTVQGGLQIFYCSNLGVLPANPDVKMILNVRHAIQLLFGFGERGIVWGLVKCFICREDVGQMTWLFEFYIRMVFTFEVFQPMSPTYYNINNPNTPQSHLQHFPQKLNEVFGKHVGDYRSQTKSWFVTP